MSTKNTDYWRSRHWKEQRDSISIHLVQILEDPEETKERPEAKRSADKQRKLQKQLKAQRIPVYQQNMYPDLFILTYVPLLLKNQLNYMCQECYHANIPSFKHLKSRNFTMINIPKYNLKWHLTAV